MLFAILSLCLSVSGTRALCLRVIVNEEPGNNEGCYCHLCLTDALLVTPGLLDFLEILGE